MSTTTEKQNIQLAVRIDAANPLHHLWNNNGTWWCHFTLHNDSYQKQRVRMSLGTNDSSKAIRKRDLLFARISPAKSIAAQ
ncbi:MAG: hypothetical protein KJO21_08920 [Verrucomicrobiae bacterium]|nr:hypothetical protein [Verrucomicrobiae bacterium]NNJ42295.1 hypothetical protein [Akkermansiaceae bacterium]